LRIHFRTYGNPEIRVINLDAFDFSCATPVKIFDVTANFSGEISGKFVDYTWKKNRDLIENTFTKTVFFPKLSDEQLDTLSKYPEMFVCKQ